MPHHKLHAFGSNGSGQLGIGHTEDTAIPQECTGLMQSAKARIVNVASGGNHAVAFFTNGTIAYTGDNSDGRCSSSVEQGINTAWSHADPSIHQQGSIEHVAATWSAGVLSCRPGRFYSSGSGNAGEMGLGSGTTLAPKLEEIHDFPPPNDKIVKVTSSMGHVVVVLKSGEVWGWGRGRNGQLGAPAQNVWTPRRLRDVPFRVIDAVCGKEFTCLFGDSSAGELAIFGLDRNDRFGVKKSAPEKVPGWVQVAASWGTVYVLMESGKLLAWGRNDHGQLPPTDLPLLDAIAAGSEHCLGLTEDGRVLAWGWGEHGNCGIETDTDGDVKGRWNEIDVSAPAAAIFAGCATSFVLTTSDAPVIPAA